jgi:ATP-dependent RNA helicase RhlB
MVGTPGRVLDLNKSGRMNLMDIAFLVLDEADRMFDMGFYPDLRKLIKVVPPADRRQTMLFSATLNAWVKNLAWEYTRTPFEIEIKPELVTVEEIDQILYHVPSEEKMKLLLGIFEREQPESAIIFCNTKRYTEIVAKRLRLNGYDCEFIIGDLPQSRRLKVINDVKAGKTRFLAATDVAARGLDIEGLAMVVNYDLPNEAENYVHRIGRTARAGKTGRAITLASEQDVYELPAIERYIGKKIPSEIAAPELHATEDKSAGQRIQTEFYEDRGEKRHPHIGHGAHSAAHGSGVKTARPGSHRTESRSEVGGKSHGIHPHGKAGGRLQEGRHQGRGQAPASRGNAVPSGKKDENRRQVQHQDHQQGRRQDAPQNLSHLSFEERMALYKRKYDSGAHAPHRHDKQAGRKKTGKTQAPPQKPENLSRPQQQPESAPSAKKGVFSRLLGAFKRK